jgi:hypothetical protein
MAQSQEKSHRAAETLAGKAIGKKPETCQNKANGFPPSVTRTHDRLEELTEE